MMHNRRWCLQLVHDRDELADKLLNYSWCCCAGFQLEEFLWLNDSTSPDAVQEYAVVRCSPADGEEYRQVESITVGWCNRAELLDYIDSLQAGQPPAGEVTGPVAVTRTAAELLQALGMPGGSPGFVVKPRLETPAQHGSCDHCA